MKLVIDEKDIKQAIRNYVEEMFATLPEESEFNIDLRAGRGPEGFTAEIKINEEPEPEIKKLTPSAEKPAGTRRGRKPKAKVEETTTQAENASTEAPAAPEQPALVPITAEPVEVGTTEVRDPVAVETQTENLTEAQVEEPAAEQAVASAEIIEETDTVVSTDEGDAPAFVKNSSIFGNNKSVFRSE